MLPVTPSTTEPSQGDEPAVTAPEGGLDAPVLPIEILTEKWDVISMRGKSVPPDILQVLSSPETEIDRVHRRFKDLFIRYDDNGEWNVNLPKESPAYQWLDRVRDQAAYPDVGENFYLVIMVD